jgi:hypothetical protein
MLFRNYEKEFIEFIKKFKTGNNYEQQALEIAMNLLQLNANIKTKQQFYFVTGYIEGIYHYLIQGVRKI